MNCLPLSALELFATSLTDGFRAELYLTPKPGLVDLLDNGSHADLTLPLMVRSVDLIDDYLQELAHALYHRQTLSELQQIALRAEQRMLAELISNTHRGGIFLGGLLLAGYAECGSHEPEKLENAVALVAQRYLLQARLGESHGQQARSRYRTGGIITEALNGLPGVFQVALPSLRDHADNLRYGCFLAMARLMRHCDDTTCLHRGGQAGLDRLRKAGDKLEHCLRSGGDSASLLRELNEDFRARNLTMGGVADLLGLAFGYLNFSIASDGFAPSRPW
ncbi:triphosphoribosyl-dephospho-CoA synthase [Malonomonas rubra]|uniref:triphosphoribosyl-dephospho-CoA synthase n=1 Tax=Malonomonas rubra TaxID=57040 RepID=UPI0026F2A4E5|nr:triphosphoribosyl-dephospho-CoA synthase [Malonomonas rubra]